ncbi:phospho-sugar mutase [Ornithinibacillus sp. BX22]|uniref:Phosphoglucomutase n=2 Tax=Ornithinibacillus TaxID=484508 RepID=A0A923L340_9BACI|nr:MULTISPECIES: phospho-sugar mutase [Ornithinibacillus]MBC5635576.1 phospho-sugar mutase [Ornithinibacillus hominis]MBS3679187.1 phospho-sugar mutase [Ornithinibacillus massiliensis]
MTNWKSVYEKWNAFQSLDSQLKKELDDLQTNQEKLEDAFYKELTFGTGGIRGVLGVGTNRMNIYTIRKAVHGLAEYLLNNVVNVKDRGVVVAYDSRYMSREFAIETAKTLGVFGIRTYVFKTIRPTPLLSFAVRFLGTAAGVMITASHNPPEYNGFKVYNEDGGQMVPNEANKIIEAIQQIENELEIPVVEQEVLEQQELLIWIDEEVDNAYLQQLKQITKLPVEEVKQEKDLNIVFTPLHGTAYSLVTKGLEQLAFTNVSVVEEQAKPDPEFSTVASPNPEEHQAFSMAIELGKKVDADILLGTDPDADRLGVAVKNEIGDYTVLTGNQLGALLVDYILSHTNKVLLSNYRLLKTIVTSELGQAVAKSYGVKTINTLTGFKYISEKIHQFDSTGEAFAFGYEESYGYLISSFTRDKDAVQAAVMASEMAYYWKQQGKSLLDALDGLYEKHGYYREGMSSLTLEGMAGTEKIALIMNTIRENSFKEIAGYRVEQVEDYLVSERYITSTGEIETIELPQENVLKFILQNNNWVCLRPSGTEPKIKCYFGTCGASLSESEETLGVFKERINQVINEIIS